MMWRRKCCDFNPSVIVFFYVHVHLSISVKFVDSEVIVLRCKCHQCRPYPMQQPAEYGVNEYRYNKYMRINTDSVLVCK